MPDDKNIDYTQFPPEFVAKLQELEKKTPEAKQLQALSDIAELLGKALKTLDSSKNDNTQSLQKLGVLLTDTREQLVSLNKKEAPDTPDFSAPVVKAIQGMQAQLSNEIHKIDTQPVVNVPAPQVKVDAPFVQVDAPKVTVDTAKIEKLIRVGLPQAFQDAIAMMPMPEKEDNTAVLEALGTMNEWLRSIDHQSRLKPQPGTMKVANPDGTAPNQEFAVILDTTTDPVLYQGTAVIGTATSSAAWKICRMDTSFGLVKTWADGDSSYDNVWDNRASLTYL